MKLVLRILIALTVITSVGASQADAQTLKKIRIGYPSLSFRQSNVWVAKEVGLFNKYGLDVEPIFLRGGQMATQALVAGDPPIVNIGTVVQASLQGYRLFSPAKASTSLKTSRAKSSALAVSARRPTTLPIFFSSTLTSR